MNAQAMLMFLAVCFSGLFPASAMTLTGPITASTVTVLGSVTLSSMTVSSLTVTNLLQVSGTAEGIKGSILQMRFSSSTVSYTEFGDINYHAVPALKSTITLSDPANYVRVSLSGLIFSNNAQVCSCDITIMRSSGTYVVDLGDTVNHTGLATVQGSTGLHYVSSGVTLIDSPGSAGPFTYQAYIRATDSHLLIGLADISVGYLLLEEIRR